MCSPGSWRQSLEPRGGREAVGRHEMAGGSSPRHLPSGAPRSRDAGGVHHRLPPCGTPGWAALSSSGRPLPHVSHCGMVPLQGVPHRGGPVEPPGERSGGGQRHARRRSSRQACNTTRGPLSRARLGGGVEDAERHRMHPAGEPAGGCNRQLHMDSLDSGARGKPDCDVRDAINAAMTHQTSSGQCWLRRSPGLADQPHVATPRRSAVETAVGRPREHCTLRPTHDATGVTPDGQQPQPDESECASQRAEIIRLTQNCRVWNHARDGCVAGGQWTDHRAPGNP